MLNKTKIKYKNYDPKYIAKVLSKGKVVGFYSGFSEYGPRALGNRSILADPRRKNMRNYINKHVKHRELFRPFAPAILQEDSKKFFGIDKLNIKRSEVPAVTHVDYSARIQTVNKDTNNRYYDLILKFKEKTGCPIIVNTSFNVRGEPIVNTPTDAFNCFMGTELDYLVIGDCILDKNKQDKNLKKDYKSEFELD